MLREVASLLLESSFEGRSLRLDTSSDQATALCGDLLEVTKTADPSTTPDWMNRKAPVSPAVDFGLET